MTLPRRRALGILTILAALVGLVASLAGSDGIALAHADLISTSPTNQSLLDDSPTEIALGFSESVDPVDPAIRVVDDQGNDVEIGGVDQSGGSDTLRAPITEPLADGTYVVAWQAISADSHRIRGAFTFSVGEATTTAPGVIDGLFDAESSGGADSLLIGIGRFLSYAGIAVLIGVFAMGSIVLPSRLGSRRVGALLRGATAIAVVGTLWMIAAQAHLISGNFLSWGAVADTQSGRWWIARLIGVAGYGALVIVVAARRGDRERAAIDDDVVTAGARRWDLVALIVLGLALLSVVSAGGHAITGDDVPVAMVATIVHLGAMTVWLGGLVLLAAAPSGLFWRTAQRVSPWALGAVVALGATGTFNAWRQLGSISALTDSAYGRWLVVKVLLVVFVVVVAMFSRWIVRHRESNHAEVVRGTVGIELVGMVLVLMATAGLVNTAPPPSAAQLGSASAIVGNRIVQVELDPAVTGGTEMHVYLTSPGGGLDRADEITVSATLPAADLGPIDIETVPAGPNHVIGPDVDLPIPGLWTFEIVARFGEFDQVVFTMQLDVAS